MKIARKPLATLVYELSQLLDVPMEEKHKRGSTPFLSPVSAPLDNPVLATSHIDSANDRVLFEQIKEKLKYRDICHAMLSDEKQTEEQRRVNALLILDLSDQITEDYERHEHFKKHNVLPPAKVPVQPVAQCQVPEAELADRKKEISNIRSKISFYKKKVKDLAPGHKAEYNASLVLVWQKALEELLAK